MGEDRYNGWTNRETWAVALYINNDQGWQESVLDALREGPWGDEGGYDRVTDRAGQIIRENVEQVLWGDHVGDTEHVNEAVMMAIEDIGSLWRVNWTELGAAFLEDLDDGTSGQDRESYSDTQDRDNYTSPERNERGR